MIRRLFHMAGALVVAASAVSPLSAQAGRGNAPPPPPTLRVPTVRSYPERAIKHDIPMTPIIRRAHTAGTRDSTGRPGRNYWQLKTDYTINASIDPTTSRLTGREKIVIHNNSTTPLTRIGLRLDQNIFRAHSYLASSWMPSEVTDGFVITKVTVNGASMQLNPAPGAGGGRGGAAPTTLTPQNFTMTNAGIGLPTELQIAAGSTATLEIEWNNKIAGGPGGSGHRMTSRWADSLYQMTQWYPRVSVYDDLRGWDPEIYLGPSEFYNNFGRFDVTIDAPAGWIVGGTGVLQNPEQVLTATARQRLATVTQSDARVNIVSAEEAGPGKSTAMGDANGRLQWHFVADTVNDFAFGTAKNYIWEATRATIPGRGVIPVYMYYSRGVGTRFNNADVLARHALEFYSELFMPYEFPQMTMIDGPSNGMEYPMVVMSGSGAADHEIAHSWWPMMVSNNETWYGWMDEGFNQYMNVLSAVDRADPNWTTSSVPMPGLTPEQRAILPQLNRQGQSWGSRANNESEVTLMSNGNYAATGYSSHTYGRTPLMLSMLGGIVSDSAVQRAQADYAKAWKFKHPSPWDYMFFMNNALKQDLGWFWYYWLFTTEGVHGSIQNVKTTGTNTAVTVRQDGDMPSPVVLRVEFAGKGSAIRPMRNARMENDSTAIVTFPVDVWWNGSRTYVANLVFGGRKINKITLDPFQRFPDRDASDNVWPRGAATPAPAPGRAGGAGNR